MTLLHTTDNPRLWKRDGRLLRRSPAGTDCCIECEGAPVSSCLEIPVNTLPSTLSGKVQGLSLSPLEPCLSSDLACAMAFARQEFTMTFEHQSSSGYRYQMVGINPPDRLSECLGTNFFPSIISSVVTCGFHPNNFTQAAWSYVVNIRVASRSYAFRFVKPITTANTSPNGAYSFNDMTGSGTCVLGSVPSGVIL